MSNTKKIIIVLTNMAAFLLIAFHAEVWVWIINYVTLHGWLMLISQAAITLVGVPAIFLSQSLDRNTRRWASVLGLAGQPFWYMMAYATSGWGVFVMSLFYTWAWWTGFKNYWLVKLVDDESTLVLREIKTNLSKLGNGHLQQLKMLADAELYKRTDNEI